MRHVYPAAVQPAEHVQLVVVQADQRRGDQRKDRRRQPAEPGLADARQQPAAAVCRQREKQGITGQLQEAERGRPAGMRADIEQRAITGQQRQKQQRRVQTDQQDQKYGMPCFSCLESPLFLRILFHDSIKRQPEQTNDRRPRAERLRRADFLRLTGPPAQDILSAERRGRTR